MRVMPGLVISQRSARRTEIGREGSSETGIPFMGFRCAAPEREGASLARTGGVCTEDLVYHTSMASSMTAEQVRAWIEGFEAIRQIDLEEMSRLGPNPKWSIAISLSMIEAARASGRPLNSPGREEADERVRRNWERLRARFLP